MRNQFIDAFNTCDHRAQQLMLALSRCKYGSSEYNNLLEELEANDKRTTACRRAYNESTKLTFTTKGDFSHLPAVGYCRGFSSVHVVSKHRSTPQKAADSWQAKEEQEDKERRKKLAEQLKAIELDINL